MFVKIFKVLRIDNWSKNLIIFIPYLLSGKLALDEFMILINVFLSFSLVVSSTYIFNDFVDIKSDKMHPTKNIGQLPLAAKQKCFGRFVR